MTPDLEPGSDDELVHACQAALAQGGQLGLEGPFRTLYDQYKDRVYNVCFRICGNGADALDASQETFGILFRKLPNFRFQSKFSSWVYRIAVNSSIDMKRRARTRRIASLDAVQEAGPDGGSRFDIRDDRIEMPMASASRKELEAEVQRALDRLSPKLRAIVVLRYTQSLSYEEIGETLKISLGTVKSRLSRAHEALDRELSPLLDKHYLG